MNLIPRRDCPICGKAYSKILHIKPFSEYAGFLHNAYGDDFPVPKDAYVVLKCECGFVWQGNIPDEQSIIDLYTRWIPDYSVTKRRDARIKLFEGYAREVDAVAHLLNKKPNEISTLDFSMGWGYWALMAKAFGYDSWGYDISPKRERYAHRLGIPTTKRVDGFEYDFINMEQILEHLPHPLKTLKTLVASLKGDGIIYISVPDGRRLQNGFDDPDFRKPPHKALEPLEHLNCFTHKTLIQMARKAGLAPIKPPFMLAFRRNVLKGILKKYHMQWLGTKIYFKKNKK